MLNTQASAQARRQGMNESTRTDFHGGEQDPIIDSFSGAAQIQAWWLEKGASFLAVSQLP